MKATEAKLIEFLKKSPQFVIPIYQRTYSWTEKECRQLWDDIVRTGGDGKFFSKFFSNSIFDRTLIFRGMLKAIKNAHLE